MPCLRTLRTTGRANPPNNTPALTTAQLRILNIASALIASKKTHNAAHNPSAQFTKARVSGFTRASNGDVMNVTREIT